MLKRYKWIAKVIKILEGPKEYIADKKIPDKVKRLSEGNEENKPTKIKSSEIKFNVRGKPKFTRLKKKKQKKT